MDATVLVAQKNGMYKNTEMCKDCLSKWPLWLDHVVRRRFLEPRYRQKYLGSRETTLRTYFGISKISYSGKTQKIEEFCLRKLFNSDFFWS